MYSLKRVYISQSYYFIALLFIISFIILIILLNFCFYRVIQFIISMNNSSPINDKQKDLKYYYKLEK